MLTGKNKLEKYVDLCATQVEMFKQSGVIPYRVRNGKIEVLLVTSAHRKHWIIPKGWVEPFMSSAASAAKEAREEAGVLGSVITPAIGKYENHKLGVACPVEIFPMQVETVLENWAESSIRERKWYSIAEAIKRVKKTQLKQMLRTLQESVESS